MRVLGGDVDLIFYAGQGAQLRFDHHAFVMGVLHDFFSQLDVLRKRLGGSVNHDGGESVVNAGLAGLKGISVVQMQHNGDLGAFNDGGLYQFHQIGAVGIGPGALGYLEDYGSLFLAAGLGNALDNFHVVDVKGSDGIPSVIGFFEHLGRSDQCHDNHLLTNLFVPSPSRTGRKDLGPLSFPLRRRKRFSPMIISQKK